MQQPPDNKEAQSDNKGATKGCDAITQEATVSLTNSKMGGSRDLVPLPMHPALAAAPNFWTLLKALRRHWLLASFIAVFTAIPVALAVWFFMPPPKHTARAILYISPVEPKIYFSTTDNQMNFDLFRTDQVARIRSQLVLNAALRQPEVAKLSLVQEQLDPAQWLEKEVRADFTLGSNRMSISMGGDDAQAITIIINAIIKTYLDEVVNKEHNRKLLRLEELKNLLSTYVEKIQAKRQTLKDLALAAGAGNNKNLMLKQELALTALQVAKRELAELQSKVRSLKVEMAGELAQVGEIASRFSRILYISPTPNLPVNLVIAGLLQIDQENFSFRDRLLGSVSPDEIVLERYIDQDPALQKLLDQKKDLKGRVDAFHRTNPPGSSSPTLQLLEKELQTIDKEMDRRRKELKPDWSAKFQDRARLEATGKRMELHQKLATLKRFEQLLLEDVTRFDKESQTINQANIRLEEINQDISHEEEIIKRLTHDVEALEVERRAPPRVTQEQEAVVYRGEATRRHLMTAGMAGLGTMGLVLFGFAWVEYRRRRITSPSEVTHDLGINLVGTLPDFNQRSRKREYASTPAGNTPWDNIMADSVDAARTMVLHATQVHGLKILAITSAVAGEGKTSSASHLAASLARSGRKTLLIDADLRKPLLHRLFDMPRTPGLSELLRGEKTIADIVQQTSVENLKLITAGRSDHLAIRLLARDEINKTFAELRDQYEIILLDCPPVLSLPDSLVLAQRGDAVILAILRDVSRLPMVYAAYQRIASLGVRILGAVVNGTRDELHNYYYYHPYFANPEE